VSEPYDRAFSAPDSTETLVSSTNFHTLCPRSALRATRLTGVGKNGRENADL